MNPDDTTRITVTLEPTGSIAGTIFQPDGQTPAAGVRVSTSNQTVTTGADGGYRFDGLPLPPTYFISVVDAQNRLRVRSKSPIKLAFAGQVFTRDFTLVGLGTVTGRVLNPDSSSAQGLVVNVNSLNAELGGPRSATTNAGGFYTIDNMPVGPFSVSTGDVARLLLGEGAGTIDADGATATVDILLVSNAVTPPVVRFDANNYRFDVQRDGSLQTGSSAFRDAGGLLLDVVSGGVPARFQGTTIGTIENGGREMAVRQQGLAGLNVTRKIFVPRNGYFARYLDIFSNPTPQPVTIDVRVTSQLQHTLLVKTSSGDAAARRERPGHCGSLDGGGRWDRRGGGSAGHRIRVRRPGRRSTRRCGNAVVRISARGGDRVAEYHRAAERNHGESLLRRAADQPSRGAGVRRTARPAPAGGAGWIEPR